MGLEGILNQLSQGVFGRSLTGVPSQMTSTSGPLTAEGQQLWNMVMGQMQNTTPTKNVNFAGNNWTIQNPGYNNLLNALMKIDSSRGSMTPFTPDQGGLLGTLAPIIGAYAGASKKTTDDGSGGSGGGALNWILDLFQGLGSSGSGGSDVAAMGSSFL